MSFFTSLGIVLISMLIQAILQVNPSVFAIFYHSALAKKSRVKADNLSLSFILGTEIFVALMLVVLYLVFLFIFMDNPNFFEGIFAWLMVGVFFAVFVSSLLFYFRDGNGTRLYLPRKITNGLVLRAEKVKTRLDAILLGFISSTFELVFTLPLFIIVIIQILNFSAGTRCVVVLSYILMSIVPLFVMRGFYRSHHNLAEIQKWRTKKKLAIRLSISLLYLCLTFLVIYLGVF